MLSLDPELIEVYLLFGIHKKAQLIGQEALQPKLGDMIFDYLDVGHDIAAMEIMEGALKAQRELPIQLLFALINRILTPPANGRYRSKSPRYIFAGCEIAQRILKNVLQVFGSSTFQGIWSSFGAQDKQFVYKRKREEEIETPEIKCALGKYLDLWDFIKKSFTVDQDENEMERERRHMVLELLISIMEQDIHMRIGSSNELDKCAFLSTISKDILGNRTHLEPYLDIIFDVFQQAQGYQTNQVLYMKSIDMAGRLLNMLIGLSYCDQLVDIGSMVQQSYHRINRLDTSAFTNLLLFPALHFYLKYVK
ncbi:hypothetical protein CLU79DRAFT_239958 [Phycomyces nitens]|nr:hypothetical protein CLU79DRAFT_239958 [Phycomyces nitens]